MAFRNGRVLRLRHGRYETAEFFLSAPPGLDTNVAWQALEHFQVPQRLFVILGTVRLLPNGRFPTPCYLKLTGTPETPKAAYQKSGVPSI